MAHNWNYGILATPARTIVKSHLKSPRSYGFLITKELIFGFQILDLKDHFSTSLIEIERKTWSELNDRASK